ncbi:hypothetical protein AVEN_227474-1 [Araneus ventricosus]|uniref:Uncharacterized protein n=1 Tax=Araneus ventricosus TaxID=182803 RepID=A0A4Y2C3A1_ARAVE|nr:hypothetical protein AVEN_227474-1 [Araneus ventricosus]
MYSWCPRRWDISFLITTKDLLHPDEACVKNMNNPASTTINRLLWPPHYKPIAGSICEDLSEQRHDLSLLGGSSTHTNIVSNRVARLCLHIRHALIPIFEVPP